MNRCPKCSSNYIKVQRTRRGGKLADVVKCGRCRHEMDARAVQPKPKPIKGWLRKFRSVTFLDLGRHSSWGSGKVMGVLPPGHPDRIVTSERQAREVAAKHGIDFATGQFKSPGARRRAEGTRAQRMKMLRGRPSIDPDSFGRKIR